MQDHRYLCLQSAYQTWSNTFWLSLLLQPSLLPISVATNWLDLLRFANREQFQTHLSATHPHDTPQLKSNIKHIHSIWVHPRLHLMACWRILYNTWTTIEVGDWGSAERRARGEEEDLSGGILPAHEMTDIWAQRVKPKKHRRGIQTRIPPPCVHRCAPPRSLPPPPPSPPQISICGDEWHIYFSTKVVCM